MKPLPRQCISRIAKEIAVGIAAAGASSPEDIEQIVQRAMEHLWERKTVNLQLRRKTQAMIAEVFKLTPYRMLNRTYFCSHIGCDVVIFKFHIERQFTEQMNWQNYADVWEIDHIKPLRGFDLTVKREYLACSNYKNLRPLLRHENRQWNTPKPEPLKPAFLRI